jgi:hypothetical protein
MGEEHEHRERHERRDDQLSPCALAKRYVRGTFTFP